MYAIVDIAGQQFKVEKDQKIFVNRLEGEEGSNVEFKDVLLVDNDGKVSIGEPHVSGASVNATILTHARGQKVKIFKKKRRKGYQKETGHRQDLTQLKIEAITA
jgi:large subunit ribosomal protein L21